MSFATITIALLATTTARVATRDEARPDYRRARGGNGVPKVVFSMQTQNHDGTTYWTVEKHGGNPGKKDTALNPKHEVACQQNFGLSNVKEIKLASYLGVENLPHSLIHDKKNIRRCKHKRTKHSCPSGIRDVIECGSC
ncbi:hypothetical protein PG999_003318 [Apiospora kogelbergensis]|uniref:Uncharacterized protein n=1 Tax=Apiospora kogelbergensis TaxID=1337665 RepID=A0AAW0R3D1_9PEZI